MGGAVNISERQNVPNGEGLPTAVPYKPLRNDASGKPLSLPESNRSNGPFCQVFGCICKVIHGQLPVTRFLAD